MQIELREVTVENLGAVLGLEVAEAQRGFVATNAKSIAQAHFYEEAWYRAIYADDEPVGFLMLHDEHQRAERMGVEPREVGYYFLWRMMIGAGHQGRGIGREAVALLIEHVKTRPHAARLLTSCRQGEGSPEGFYRTLGFEPTGKLEEGELELVLPLEGRAG